MVFPKTQSDISSHFFNLNFDANHKTQLSPFQSAILKLLEKVKSFWKILNSFYFILFYFIFSLDLGPEIDHLQSQNIFIHSGIKKKGACSLNLLKHHHHPSSHLDRLGIDDFDVEEEVRPDFPCPYCYEDFDLASLCSHLEEEHSCESRVTICPICSVKVARDMLSHITLQHGHLFKLQRRRRLRRVAIPNSQTLSLLGRDLREAHLQVLLGGGGGGGGGYRSNSATVSNAAADPFLSSFILNFPACEAEEISKSVVTSAEDSSAKNTAPAHIWKSSFDPSLSIEEREKRMRQAAGRSGFVQDLFLSTLLGD